MLEAISLHQNMEDMCASLPVHACMRRLPGCAVCPCVALTTSPPPPPIALPTLGLQISLAVFLQIFKRALEWEDHSTEVGSRLAMLNATLVKLVYGYVSRSLFNADRLTLAMHMAHHLAPDQFRDGEWDLFVGKLVANEAAAASAASAKPAWVPEARTADYTQLVTAFPGLASECQFEAGQAWSPWLLSAEAERELPPAAAGRLSPFQALLVLEALRPDRLQSGMSRFVCNVLGMKSVAPEPFSLKSLHEVLPPSRPAQPPTTAPNMAKSLSAFCNLPSATTTRCQA